MTFNLLISCMHQKNASILERSNVQSDVVVVNQCDHDSVDEFDFVNKKGRTCHCKFINTTERGLSRSRNMAIRNAWGNICQICDDDEVMADDGEEKILKAYAENPEAGVIAFALIRNDNGKTYPDKKKVLGFKQILRTSSHQITFSRSLMGDQQIWFDEKMGSGTGNGGGEENMFMFDCKRRGFKMLYIPEIIGTVNPGESQWFNGYDEKYFENLGWTDRRLFGPFIGFIYLIYWPIFRRSVYVKSKISVWSALYYSLKGYFNNR